MKEVGIFLGAVCLGLFLGIKASKDKLKKKITQLLKDYEENLSRSIEETKRTGNKFLEIEGTIKCDTAFNISESLVGGI